MDLGQLVVEHGVEIVRAARIAYLVVRLAVRAHRARTARREEGRGGQPMR
ncbi:hypothetical protein [Streptomyces sp. NPDC050504]